MPGNTTFHEIAEKWPEWKSEETRSFLKLMDDSDMQKTIENILEEKAKAQYEEEQKSMSPLARISRRPGLFGLGGVLPSESQPFISYYDEIENIKKKIRGSIEEKFYSERLKDIKKHAFYKLFSSNQDFKKARQWIKDRNENIYKGAKAEFNFTHIVFHQLFSYIVKYKNGQTPKAFSKANIRKIITASENLRSHLKPCNDDMDLYRYEIIVSRILTGLEDVLKPRLKKNRTRQDNTFLEREYVKGLSGWFMAYYGDVSPKLIYILTGIIEYEISERNIAKQISDVKKGKEEQADQFSTFEKSVNAQWW